MAIDAVGRNVFSKLFGHSASLPLMAAKALGGVAGGGLLWRVRVVAGRASHGRRRQEAATALQQADLISVDIRMLDDRGGEGLEKFTEGSTGNIGECRCDRLPLNAVVAKSAQVDLSISGESRWIQDSVIHNLGCCDRLSCMSSHVCLAGTVAGLARDSRNKGIGPKAVRGWISGERFEVG